MQYRSYLLILSYSMTISEQYVMRYSKILIVLFWPLLNTCEIFARLNFPGGFIHKECLCMIICYISNSSPTGNCLIYEGILLCVIMLYIKIFSHSIVKGVICKGMLLNFNVLHIKLIDWLIDWLIQLYLQTHYIFSKNTLQNTGSIVNIKMILNTRNI